MRLDLAGFTNSIFKRNFILLKNLPGLWFNFHRDDVGNHLNFNPEYQNPKQYRNSKNQKFKYFFPCFCHFKIGYCDLFRISKLLFRIYFSYFLPMVELDFLCDYTWQVSQTPFLKGILFY